MKKSIWKLSICAN